MVTDYARRFEDEILPLVEKPSRYLGNEVNSIHKDPERVRLRIVLAFPDLYDLGLGNLGLQILYALLNQQPDVWAERVYAPAVDAEAEMRRRSVPLLSLESRTPLKHFDAVGFTLQSELTYTNILNMLDLGGIPVLARDREDRDPIILAGGPCVVNPEPLVDFIDAFAVGDGEEVVLEIAAALRQTQGAPRRQRLEALAALPGVYVPACYPDFVPLEDGTLVPPPGAPRIVKRLVRDLNQAPFPTASYIVPYTQQVHDRISLEVLRGCTQSCRFCQAGMVTRPVRERDLEKLDRLLVELLDRTGYEEISLVSLSTCDYSRVKSLVRQSVARAVPQRAGVSLPSLRLDSFSVELADMMSAFRKSGITFAPEAASDRLRSVINKPIPDEELLQMAEECFRRGWEMVKLYFMIGLPTEADEDIIAIADLVRRVLEVGRAVRRSARVNLSVSTFVPKPHTPFQWDAQIALEETERRQELLARHLPRGADWSRHLAQESFLEGIIARGDRRVGGLLYAAHQLGCRFDAWGEHLNWPVWQEAMRRWTDATGSPPEALLHARSLEEPLPWDHIDILVSREWLRQDYWRSRDSLWHHDCRRHHCDQCGVMDRERDHCLTMLRRSHQGARQDEGKEWTAPSHQESPPVQRLRFRYARRGQVRYLSGLEEMNVLQRALRRAHIPVSYSQGFSPKQRLAFAVSLPTGYESEAEYADLWLVEREEPDSFRRRLNAELPEGYQVLAAWEVPLGRSSLSEEYQGAEYRLELPKAGLGELAGRFAEHLAHYLTCPAISVLRHRKRGKPPKPTDIRPAIESLELEGEAGNSLLLRMRLREQGEVRTKVREVLETLLGADHPALPYIRVRKMEALGVEREGQEADAELPITACQWQPGLDRGQVPIA